VRKWSDSTDGGRNPKSTASAPPAVLVYAAARAVARRVHEHFLRHRDGARAEGDELPVLVPGVSEIEVMVEAAFWASVRREENSVPTISLTFLPPGRAICPLLLDRALPLSAATLARLGPAVERPSVHLGVWRGSDGLSVCGLTWEVPPFCFAIEVITPGLLVVKHGHSTYGKLVNVAVLEGDQVKLIDECPSNLLSPGNSDAGKLALWIRRVGLLERCSEPDHRVGGFYARAWSR
jgi:hypothetical protein